jgi:hypothetical protein
MTSTSAAGDLPTVEQRAVAASLRQLYLQLAEHGPLPPPASAAALVGQVPLLPSRVLREAVARGYQVLNIAGLRGLVLGELEPDGRHWVYASMLALDELHKRETRALAEVAAQPPAWLVAAIGRHVSLEPSGPDPAGGSWLQVTAHVLAYRLQYTITDPTRILGACPIGTAGLAQETDWRVVMGEIRWTPGNLDQPLADPRELAVFGARGPDSLQQALGALSDRSFPRADLAQARRRRILAAPSRALRQWVAQALGLLRQRPADRSAELDRLQATRDTLEVVDKHAPTPQTDRRGELDTAIAAASRAQTQRRVWDVRHAEVVATGRVAAHELLQREHEALGALEANPPEHLLTELGQPPAGRVGRDLWRRGARLIEGYRTHHEIGDPLHAFGRAPEDRQQRARLATVRQALDRIKDSLQLTATQQQALPPPPSAREPTLDP